MPSEIISSRAPWSRRPTGPIVQPADQAALATVQSWLAGEPVWPRARILDEWAALIPRDYWSMLPWRKEDGEFDVDRVVSRQRLRDEYIQQFGFAIPCAELMDELAALAPIVEIGAGTGYMTRLMHNRGIRAIGSDIEYRGPNRHGFMTASHDALQVTGTPGKTMVRRFYDHTVFCSWPTLQETWFRQALKAMQIGRHVVVIREECCADDRTWDYLDGCFEPVKEIAIPSFEHINDWADVRIKKRNRPR